MPTVITRKPRVRGPRNIREGELRLYQPNLEPPVPFLKWAGGKTQLLPVLEDFFPQEIKSYVEPFLGGGAVFFFLQGRGWLKGDVLLADTNDELMNTYRAIRNRVDDVISELADLRKKHCEKHYYEVRDRRYRSGPKGAARTIYLNKTGFNGLYRVNGSGKFNVPMGRYENPSIFSEDALRRVSAALAGARLLTQDFRKTIAKSGKRDLIYLDPPYVPLSKTASFTSYVAGGFGMNEQAELAEAVRAAHKRGARFVLSNSYTPDVRNLYEGFRIETVSAKRMINCNGNARGPVKEAIVLNFERQADDELRLVCEKKNGRKRARSR
jgi:DNA adenine methylase